MKTRKISRNELLGILLTQKDCTFAGLKTITEPDMDKTGNPYIGKILKVSFLSSVLGYVYENVINNRRIKDAKELDSIYTKFQSAGLKWGKFISKMVIENKGKYYLQNMILNTRKPVYIWADSGKKLTQEEINDAHRFFKKSSGSSRQHLSAKREVTIRTYNIDNIQKINMNGVKYIVE